MTEEPDPVRDGQPAAEPTDDPAGTTPPAPGRVRTGVESVDQVIITVGDLEERPIEEHVAAFENAHEQLRGALDARPPDGA